MKLTVKDVLKMEKVMSKVKDVVSNSVTITDRKNAGSIRLTECMMPEFDGFDICYLPNNKEEAGSYLGSFFIENVDSGKPKMIYYDDAYEEKGKKEIPLYENVRSFVFSKRNRKIYISGKISGTDDYLERFADAEKVLLEQGYEVVNPAREGIKLENASYEDYMELSFQLLKDCDIIYMLKDWRTSPGANQEYGYALAKGMEIRFEK